MSIHEEAAGGQQSLTKQWAMSYISFPIYVLLHGPCIVELGVAQEHLYSLNLALDIYNPPFILTQAE